MFTRVRLWLILVCLVVGILFATVGAWYYAFQEQAFRAEVLTQLETIALAKRDALLRWRSERFADAAALNTPIFASYVSDWLSNRTPEGKEALLAQMRTLQKQKGYANVFLVTPSGEVTLSLEPLPDPPHPEVLAALPQALATGEPCLIDFHLARDAATPHSSVLAPLLQDGEPVGALVLWVDPWQSLYPLLASWPVPSRTAETLLVRREGDAALFLNNPRHAPGMAFRLRIPLSERGSPAVEAVLGHEGPLEGIDYRDVPVIAFAFSIPDSPWYLVSKIDVSEAFAPWRIRSRLFFLLFATGVGVVVLAAGFLWQRFAKGFYRDRFQLMERLQEQEERYRATLMSVGDGIIETDIDGRVTLMNPVAEALTGWPFEEAEGRQLGEIFRIVNEETRQPVESPIWRVLQEGHVVGLANHTLLISRDGIERPIADSGAPVRSPSGEVRGVVLVFRDQSEVRAAQRALEESETRFRALFEANPLPTALYTLDGHLVACNRAMGEALGYTLEELATLDPTHPEDRADGAVLFRQLAAGEIMGYGREKRYIRKDGQVIWARLHAFIIPDARGNPLYVALIFEDITEQKRMVEALAEERRLLRTIVDNLPDAIYIKDKEARKILANPMDLENMGVDSEANILGMTDTEIFPWEFAQHTMADDRQVLETGIPILDREERLVTKDGKSKWLLTSKIPFYNERGEIAGLVGIGHDITAFKRRTMIDEAMAALARAFLEPDVSLEEGSQQLLARAQDLSESPHGAVFCVDFASGEMLLRTPLEGLPYLEPIVRRENEGKIILPQEKGRYPDPWGRALNTGEPFYTNAPAELVDLSEGEVPNCWLAVPVIVAGDVVGLVVVANAPSGYDEEVLKAVSRLAEIYGLFVEQKRTAWQLAEAEERFLQAQKMEAIGRLAGGVAHDFNNMLSVISGYGELGRAEVEPGSELDLYLKEILNAARRSSSLVSQLLAFARRQTIQPQVLDLAQVLKDHERMLQRLVGEDIQVRLKAAPDLWPVYLDPTQVTQILMNLASNSRDAIEGVGTITIEVENVRVDAGYANAHGDCAPGDYVRLSFADTGRGMTEEVRAHLFEPFFTTKPVGQGTGLGLATVYGIVKQNNGFINVYSEVGQGTVFKLYFPRHVQEPAPSQEEFSLSQEEPGRGTILLVEDEPQILNLYREALSRQGYTVLATQSPEEALRLCREHEEPIDLLITDVIMPSMDGRTLAQEIERLKPGTKVLFLSGYSFDHLAERGVLPEGVHFLSKPVDLQTLMRRVREVMEGG